MACGCTRVAKPMVCLSRRPPRTPAPGLRHASLSALCICMVLICMVSRSRFSASRLVFSRSHSRIHFPTELPDRRSPSHRSCACLIGRRLFPSFFYVCLCDFPCVSVAGVLRCCCCYLLLFLCAALQRPGCCLRGRPQARRELCAASRHLHMHYRIPIVRARSFPCSFFSKPSFTFFCR